MQMHYQVIPQNRKRDRFLHRQASKDLVQIVHATSPRGRLPTRSSRSAPLRLARAGHSVPPPSPGRRGRLTNPIRAPGGVGSARRWRRCPGTGGGRGRGRSTRRSPSGRCLPGTAKPMPWAMAIMAVLTPTTRPRLSTSGPPLLPGFSGAVCWMMFSISRPSLRAHAAAAGADDAGRDRGVEAQRLPIAITSWPTRRASESPSVQIGRSRAARRTSARSVAGSSPMNSASSRSPSWSWRSSLLRPCDDVAVGQGVAVGSDHEPGALAALALIARRHEAEWHGRRFRRRGSRPGSRRRAAWRRRAHCWTSQQWHPARPPVATLPARHRLHSDRSELTATADRHSQCAYE